MVPIGIQHPASMTVSYPITNLGVRDRLWARCLWMPGDILRRIFEDSTQSIQLSLRDIMSRIN